MAAAENKKSFWEIFAVVVGAIAALITAIAALLAAMNGGAAKEKDVSPAAQAAPSKPPPAVDAEAERLKAEVEEVRAKAAELERKLAESEQKKAAAAVALSKPKQGDTITDEATGMKLVYVPEGCFMMGSPYTSDQAPVHMACVDGFYMGKYEVTQGQWQKIMGSNPSKFKKGDYYPVDSVSWKDVQQFIKKINEKSGRIYRLPTEAEWEYACRAGVSNFSKYCGGDNVDEVAWYSENSEQSTHPVGGQKANAFGLYDMSGNVYEWCVDWYEDGYYASSPKDNPMGPESGRERVLRGGSFSSVSLLCRSANRLENQPTNQNNTNGFRLVMPVR